MIKVAYPYRINMMSSTAYSLVSAFGIYSPNFVDPKFSTFVGHIGVICSLVMDRNIAHILVIEIMKK